MLFDDFLICDFIAGSNKSMNKVEIQYSDLPKSLFFVNGEDETKTRKYDPTKRVKKRKMSLVEEVMRAIY